ncbi:19116_t:CDS:2, partial [Funneliformis geosporum]
ERSQTKEKLAEAIKKDNVSKLQRYQGTIGMCWFSSKFGVILINEEKDVKKVSKVQVN